MKVNDNLILSKNHSIEWGDSTWDDNDFSIRNRFDTDDGRFNKAGSSEIPWNDFMRMIIESVRKNYFSQENITDILRIIGENYRK